MDKKPQESSPNTPSCTLPSWDPSVKACSAEGLVGIPKIPVLHNCIVMGSQSTYSHSLRPTLDIILELELLRFLLRLGVWDPGNRTGLFFLLVFPRHFYARLPDRRKTSYVFEMQSAYYRWVFCYYIPPFISKSRWKWKTVSYSKNHIIIIINLNSYCEYLQPQWSDLSSVHLRVLIVCTWMYLHILHTLHYFHSW